MTKKKLKNQFTRKIYLHKLFDSFEVSEMGEIDGTEVFKTLAQKKVGEKEYRILKNAFYHSKYFGKPNVIENRYFVVRVEHSLINVVNRSNNWDEIRFSYEQLISDKGK